MSYEVVLSPTAQQDFDRIPEHVQPYLADHLRPLGENTAGMSRSAVFPFLPNGQMSHFRQESFDGTHDCVVLFRFSQDETRLEVGSIGYIHLGTSDQDDPND